MAFTIAMVLAFIVYCRTFAQRKERIEMKKITIDISAVTLITIVLLSLNACGGKKGSKVQDGDSLKGEISLSGAFALYPLAVKWADDFKQLHPDVKIDISAGGAGKGITDALADVVDLGMVSRDLADDEIKKGAMGFAVAKDAVVPTINAHNPNLKAVLSHGLSLKTAAGLWITRKVKTWGQVAGNANPNGITVYTRSDACGAAATWAKWLGKKQEDLIGTGVFGDPGVASAIQKDPNGIGFNNIGYAYDAKTGKPNPGILVVPIDVNDNGKVDPEEDFYATQAQLVKAIADGRYPSPPARDLFFVTHGKPTKPVVIAFLKFVLSKEGQKENIPQGYITISQDKINNSLQQLH